ncbi:CheR family methyltransferase [Chondromyces apiculatus]|uniref:Chemotaxis protein methyltransferase CheR n=1 Tax=Chondromyces apiculatus DSM 436 TaxID=1192034 RepID=A0A017T729_9BACT|nr:protein-glutamate O-methyltransferase CheR [Chondromyces apiculatus]EYF04590.1 Chemotaxis protein methyltransferase CheR [Chondromyces apiculatus DSM 436]
MTLERAVQALSDRVRGALEAEIRELLGLVFLRGRGRDFDVGIARTMELLELDDPELLLQRIVAREPVVQEALATALTVGETYFFRHPEHFQLVRERVIPEALRRRYGGMVRLWSAGCATGEEPYSMALVALELLGPSASQRVEVLATDLSPTALTRARAGRYGPWSFRGVAESVKQRWFVPEDGLQRVSPEVQQMVRFDRFNLADATRPGSPWPGDMDAVFCRNVLIYLDSKVREAFFVRMAGALVSGGRLVLSPSDPVPGRGCGLMPRHEDGHNVYQPGQADEAGRSGHTPPAPAVSPEVVLGRVRSAQVGSAQVGPGKTPPLPRRSAVSPGAEPRTYPHATTTQPPSGGKASAVGAVERPAGGERRAKGAAEARRLADEGETTAALEMLEGAIAEAPLEVALYLLRATVLLDDGQADAAAQDARRAMMLDPERPAAHLVAAAAAVQLGEDKEAARGIRNARTLLLGLPADAAVSDLGDAQVTDALAYCQRLEQVLAQRSSGRAGGGTKAPS